MPRKIEIVNVRRGKGYRSIYVYAEARDSKTKELLIGATAEYIQRAAFERKYEITACENSDLFFGQKRIDCG